MAGPGTLGVSQPKLVVYKSPAEIMLLLMKRERWIFNNRRVILTLNVHWLGPLLFLPGSPKPLHHKNFQLNVCINGCLDTVNTTRKRPVIQGLLTTVWNPVLYIPIDSQGRLSFIVLM